MPPRFLRVRRACRAGGRLLPHPGRRGWGAFDVRTRPPRIRRPNQQLWTPRSAVPSAVPSRSRQPCAAQHGGAAPCSETHGLVPRSTQRRRRSPEGETNQFPSMPIWRFPASVKRSALRSTRWCRYIRPAPQADVSWLGAVIRAPPGWLAVPRSCTYLPCPCAPAVDPRHRSPRPRPPRRAQCPSSSSQVERPS